MELHLSRTDLRMKDRSFSLDVFGFLPLTNLYFHGPFALQDQLAPAGEFSIDVNFLCNEK